MWKISRGEPRNLANWPAEFRKICRRKLWSYSGYPCGGSHFYALSQQLSWNLIFVNFPW